MSHYLKLARFGNTVIAFFSIVAAGILCGASLTKGWKITAAAVAAALITAGGNSINDFYDVEIDRINRPDRPLASGKLSPRQALTFYLASTAAGLAISAAISMWALLISLAASALVFLYSYVFKRMLLVGNVVVATVTGLAFIYGGAVLNDLSDVFPAAVLAFLVNLIREIIKDAEDVNGDARMGVSTVATKYGTNTSAIISISLTLLLIVAASGAFIVKLLPIQFLTVCGLTIFPIGIYISYLLIARKNFSEASFGYKLIMIFGLVALIVGKV